MHCEFHKSVRRSFVEICQKRNTEIIKILQENNFFEN